MALTHQIIGTKQYLDQWETDVVITDTATGKVRDEKICTSSQPTQEQLDSLIEKRKTIIQQEMDLEVNSLNLPADEEALLEYYRGIKIDIVLRIREYPAATLQQASDYIAGKYPDSPFKFNELCRQWLRISKCGNWEEFKQFCTNHKFIGID